MRDILTPIDRNVNGPDYRPAYRQPKPLSRLALGALNAKTQVRRRRIGVGRLATSLLEPLVRHSGRLGSGGFSARLLAGLFSSTLTLGAGLQGRSTA